MCHIEVNTLKHGPLQLLKLEREQNFGEEGMVKDKCVCERPLVCLSRNPGLVVGSRVHQDQKREHPQIFVEEQR